MISHDGNAEGRNSQRQSDIGDQDKASNERSLVRERLLTRLLTLASRLTSSNLTSPAGGHKKAPFPVKNFIIITRSPHIITTTITEPRPVPLLPTSICLSPFQPIALTLHHVGYKRRQVESPNSSKLLSESILLAEADRDWADR